MDRVKYHQNNVRIVVPPKVIITQEQANKTLKMVLILHVLGAQCEIGHDIQSTLSKQQYKTIMLASAYYTRSPIK